MKGEKEKEKRSRCLVEELNSSLERDCIFDKNQRSFDVRLWTDMNRNARKNVNHVFPVLASMHLHLDESKDKSLNRRELFSEISLERNRVTRGHERLIHKYRTISRYDITITGKISPLFPRFLNIEIIEDHRISRISFRIGYKGKITN